jgi:hypothetical protein
MGTAMNIRVRQANYDGTFITFGFSTGEADPLQKGSSRDFTAGYL